MVKTTVKTDVDNRAAFNHPDLGGLLMMEWG